MPMPTFAVSCLSRERGTTYIIAVQARSIDDARQAATAAGHITGAIHPVHDGDEHSAMQAGRADALAHQQEQFHRSVSSISANVRDLASDLASLRRSRLSRAPLSTITAGVLFGVLLAAILALLAVLAWGEYRAYLRAASGQQATLMPPPQAPRSN